MEITGSMALTGELFGATRAISENSQTNCAPRPERVVAGEDKNGVKRPTDSLMGFFDALPRGNLVFLKIKSW
jgi:hypothetical protein